MRQFPAFYDKINLENYHLPQITMIYTGSIRIAMKKMIYRRLLAITADYRQLPQIIGNYRRLSGIANINKEYIFCRGYPSFHLIIYFYLVILQILTEYLIMLPDIVGYY